MAKFNLSPLQNWGPFWGACKTKRNEEAKGNYFSRALDIFHLLIKVLLFGKNQTRWLLWSQETHILDDLGMELSTNVEWSQALRLFSSVEKLITLTFASALGRAAAIKCVPLLEILDTESARKLCYNHLPSCTESTAGSNATQWSEIHKKLKGQSRCLSKKRIFCLVDNLKWARESLSSPKRAKKRVLQDGWKLSALEKPCNQSIFTIRFNLSFLGSSHVLVLHDRRIYVMHVSVNDRNGLKTLRLKLLVTSLPNGKYPVKGIFSFFGLILETCALLLTWLRVHWDRETCIIRVLFMIFI